MNIVGRRVTINVNGTPEIGTVVSGTAGGFVVVTFRGAATFAKAFTLLCATDGCNNQADSSGIFCTDCWVRTGPPTTEGA